MSSTYTQIHIHIVFAVKGRASLIRPEWEEKLYAYIIGTIEGHGQKMLAINGMPDHVHMLIGLRPDQRISDLVREVKKASNAFIKGNGLANGFQWQEGYGAFSYTRSDVPQVMAYIRNQKEHHKKRSFKDEYLDMLRRADIDHDERYLFEWLTE